MLILLFGGVYALNSAIINNRLNIILLYATFIVALALLYSVSITKIVQPDPWLQGLITVLLILYLLILSCFKYQNLRYFASFMLVATICFELASMAHITVNNRSTIDVSDYEGKGGYNDYSIEAVNYIKSIDNTFFRINKDYSSGPAVHRSLNDAKMQHYYGTSSYDSFNQGYYIKFLGALNIIDTKNEPETKWAPGLTRLLLRTFGSVKYQLTRHNGQELSYAGFSKIGEFGDVNVFRNNLYLPLGLAFSKYILLEDFVYMPILKKDITLLNAFVINGDQKNDFSDFETFNTNKIPSFYHYEKEYLPTITDLRSNSLRIQRYSQNSIKGSIYLKERALLLFTIPFDKGWIARVDGKTRKIHVVDIGFMGLILGNGFHEIELTFSPPFLRTGFVISITSLIIFFLMVYLGLIKKGKE
jgi:uncharacterized membrane protein YfhO